MARYSAGARTAAGSTTLPIISVYCNASVAISIVEIGLSNTTATAVALKACKLTTAGTQGAGLTETGHAAAGPAATATAVNTHTVAPTVVDLGYNQTLGAAIGSGVIFTFGDKGLCIPAGTANGVGIIVATGTGQICDAYIVWDEGV